jgi:hypothetical protein
MAVTADIPTGRGTIDSFNENVTRGDYLATSPITDSSTGTPATAISDGTATYSQSITNVNNATLLREINRLWAVLVKHGLVTGIS